MKNDPDWHYEEAENLLMLAERQQDGMGKALTLAAAQAHATLATVPQQNLQTRITVD